MLRIHRSQPVVYVGEARVSLTPMEHRLLVTLGMMDNRITPWEELMAVKCEDCVQIPSDRQALISSLYRLRKKIGWTHLRVVRFHGHMLMGDVQFIGSPAGQE
jgi:DNA-binding response OmpR family regulator